MPVGQRSATILIISWTSAALLSLACGGEASIDQASYVGGDTCVGCHQEESTAWTGSHHDLAMQVPSEETVLGDFSGVTFNYYGRPTTFVTRDDAYFVTTEGQDGELHDYRIAYTFGASPLQQYLIEFPDGKLQALGVAWDARPSSAGGQRWYHLYPDEDVTPEHRLHWTGREQRWNYQCAECHSTNVQRNYDPESGSYSTTWSDLDVSCEACHGPASAHVDWANSNAGVAGGRVSGPTDGEAGGVTGGGAGGPTGGEARGRARDVGLVVDLADRDDGAWAIRPGEQIATRTPGRTSRDEISACATCHSRRQLITKDDPGGGSPLNTLRLALLEEGLYHADGQIQDEVYVYGSFLQSAMYEAGVTCSNCHDPHSARLRATGNALCASCHLTTAYDSPTHHFHELGTSGAELATSGTQCVSCHMPTQTYMGVDPRRDHSIRVPRPDLTITLGTPNACTQCHQDRSATWAADAVTRWYGAERTPHYGEVLARGRQGVPTAGPELADLALDSSQPGIARATALELLRTYGSAAVGVVEQALRDPDPLVRFGAVRASEAIPPEQRYRIVYRMLEDSTKLVRTEAARALASVPRELMPQSSLLENATIEYIGSQLLNADRPEAYLNTGVLHAARGDFLGAVAALETALQVDSAFGPAYVNLADIMRAQGREVDAERLLRMGIARGDDDGATRHALGLSLVRQQRTAEALIELRRATEADPLNARFAYVYGVALQSSGQVGPAITVLEQSLAEHPYDLAILTALLTFNRDAGDLDEAVRYAEMWVAMAPDDARAAQELVDLMGRRGR